jgi:hypothetical protein
MKVRNLWAAWCGAGLILFTGALGWAGDWPLSTIMDDHNHAPALKELP